MRIAYVIVRYGPEIVGGAELGCRMLAERLAARPGWEVDIYTTCAVDARTWADVLEPGVATRNGVRVHRFRSRTGRDPGFETFSRTVLGRPERASAAEQMRWMDLQGPVCPAVIDAAAASAADLVIFYPYLYWPTVHGVRLVAERAVIHPAAHDEAPFRLGVVGETLAAARGLVFQTSGERALAESVFPALVARPQLHMGLGIEQRAGEPAAFRRSFDLGDSPYLLCLGRIDEGKGTAMLASFFATYKRRRPGPLKLVYAGPVVDTPPAHPDIVVTGPLDEDAKWGALRAAVALVSPSPHEAFSIVLMEGWAAGLPVLVNRRCRATAEHARRSRGGLSFGDYATFEVELDRLLADPGLRAALAAAGAAYVRDNFAWDVLIDRYAAFLGRLAAGTATAVGPPTPRGTANPAGTATSV